ncbi:FAD dependent oxidoreductase [Hirsutella rhossiliensis]|uniref:FAD dependent oxidoreductase domain-containing protein n=1 Tax=Hirsutella rhossiliensis TaxID=111463 RepID=A0A9P8SI85_9HYPO|nr:FAD dependent oxidoreductase domain-containing protein [Hirsutella rhossiliensis]KAH0961761.1 FAD dependent oxidoreductase domain-containing protein [Hirsutella rhossiliensis]
MLVTIVGAGWSGCHLACELSKEGHQVILLERESRIFKGTSGSFGIRLHRGPHYPRSKATRVNCQKNFERFRDMYGDLVVDHEFSLYANGTVDSQNFPSKVSDQTFHKVCNEIPGCKKIDLAARNFAEMGCAYDVNEPSVAIGARARCHFEKKLEKAGVSLVLGATVQSIKQVSVSSKQRPNMCITFQQRKSSGPESQAVTITFLSHVAINCTGFQDFVPEAVMNQSSPVYFEHTYQACLALKFRDNSPTSTKPMSFICMDGWFPCLMPAISDTKDDATPHQDYILTHGAYTILGSYDSPEQAQHVLDKRLTDELVSEKIRGPAESEMCRFWPEFSRRFSYKGWYGSVLAKPKCPTEFRSSFTFENQGIIHVFPGKVTNVLDAHDEVLTLLQTKGASSPLIIEEDGCRFVANGVFGKGRAELRKKCTQKDRSTSSLQTLDVMVAV